MRILRLLIVLLPALIPTALTTPARAETGRAETGRAEIAGRNDLAFSAAITAWLAGDEATALPALAALASRGNAAAAIQLGLIDSIPAYQGDWLASLPRDGRIAVLRAPGGISGRNWLLEAAETEPLAQVWLRLWDGDASVEVVRDFARLGELRAAHMAARQLFLRQKRSFGALAEDPDFPPSLMPLAILDWQKSDPARAAHALGELSPGDPALRVLGQDAPMPEALLIWAQHHPLAQNLVAALGRICPGDPITPEDFAAYLGQSGGSWALAWAGPPSQGLIDPGAYAKSPKAAETALNLLRGGPLIDAETLAKSPCLQSLLSQ